MLRFIARHGLVRMIGGRAVPALLLWDLAMLANRTRRIPVVDRGLRRGADIAFRGAQSVASSRPTVGRRPDMPRSARGRPGRGFRPGTDPRPGSGPRPASGPRPDDRR